MQNEGAAYPEKEKNACLFAFLYAPSEQFNRLKERPKIIFPLFIVTVITVLGIILSAQGIDLIENDPELLQMSEGELAIFFLVSQTVFAIVGMMTPIVMIFISTVILFVVAKIVRSTVSFRQLFAMNTFIFLLDALSVFVNGLGLLFFGEIHGEETLFTSINLFFGEKGFVGAILSIIDIFTIWAFFAVWKGLRIVAQFTTKTIIFVFIAMVVFNMITFMLI